MKEILQKLFESRLSDGAVLTAACAYAYDDHDPESLARRRRLPLEVVKDHLTEISALEVGKPSRGRPLIGRLWSHYASMAQDKWPEVWKTDRRKDVAALRMLARQIPDHTKLKDKLTDFVAVTRTPNACVLSRLLRSTLPKTPTSTQNPAKRKETRL